MVVAVTSAVLALGLVGCASTALSSTNEEPDPSSTASATAEPSAVSSARVGRPAGSERVRFIPAEVQLPGAARAAVEPAVTVDGVLRVPENVRHVGWWDGSAYVGDPFGSTVIAGHVDSASDGLGFFARLRTIKVGDRVTVRSGSHHLTYRVVTVAAVAKRALSSDSRAFDQDGAHRLVLITCTGNFNRDRGGYDSNLVVIAKPLGLAR